VLVKCGSKKRSVGQAPRLHLSGTRSPPKATAASCR
jgi:hypothetical protein